MTARRKAEADRHRPICVTVPPEMDEWLRSVVGTGDYGGVSERMREAIRDFRLKRLKDAAVRRSLSDDQPNVA